MATTRKKKRRNSNQKSFWFIVLLVAIIALVYRFYGDRNPGAISEALPAIGQNEIRVFFLDVGQADSILIQTKDNAVLIDAGESVTRRRLISYLEEAGI
ncbi:MAG: hypothetical protein FWF03_05055, partial [Defluviitaleaceae bacterium]|nr:hypothetical protein [Defluviitaleaceae bacterium]